jgi:hypothetical protein
VESKAIESMAESNDKKRTWPVASYESIPPPLGPATVVHSSEYYVASLHQREQLVRLTRSPVPFSSREAVEEACVPIQELLDELDRSRVCLLVDSRNAPARNDQKYEQWFMPHRARMVSGLRRAAIVMRSAVGKLHAERMLRLDKADESVRVFTDEAAALLYLHALVAAPTRAR